MQTRDNHLIFNGLVVNIEQMDVRSAARDGTPTRSSGTREVWPFFRSMTTGALP